MLFLAAGVLATVTHLSTDTVLLKTWLQIFSYTASTVLLLDVWRTSRRSEPDSLILHGLLAFGLFSCANVVGAIVPMATGRPMAVPSVVDGMFLLSYLLFAAFFVRLGRRSASTDQRVWLDPCIVILGVAPMFWLVLVDPLLAGSTVTVQLATFLAYPALVFVLLTMMVRAAFSAFRLSVPHVLLTGWICLELVADIGLLQVGAAGTYAAGQWYQALWVMSACCVGALALHPRATTLFERREARPVNGPSRLLLLGGCLALPILTLSYAAASGRGLRGVLLPAGVALVLVVLTCLRLAKLMVDNADQRRSQQELQRLSDTLSHQALHDSLTGLANRTMLNQRLADELGRPSGMPTSVLLLDLDDFKLVNDSLGHAVGDLLLVEVARRIQLELRPEDQVGRLGGDEFVVILNRSDPQGAETLAARLLISLAQPMLLSEVEVSVSVSIGIACGDEVRDGLNLLGAADMAMYAAKQRGKAGIATFEPQMHDAADEQLALEIDLRRAVRNQELFLAYQPIVDLKTGALAGVEALVRWNDATRGPVSPELYIPIAERTGLIVALGTWVLRESIAQLHRWDQQAPRSPLVMNVNVSTRQLERPGLLAVIDELISDGLDPARLVLEITETALTLDGEAAAKTLHQLRTRGVRMAVDDFGTGYSSLSRLQAAPVSQLKIDRSFVSEITTATCLVPIIHATVAMADGLGLGVIAEGVETTVQLQYLRQLGCAHAQGYLLARPQDADAITESLTGPAPWAAVLGDAHEDPGPPTTHDPHSVSFRYDAHRGAEADDAARRDMQPSDVVVAAQAIAAMAAAEVAADAAVTAQAAVTAACAAALHAATKAERVAAQAADAAVAAARALAETPHTRHLQPQWNGSKALAELLCRQHDYTADDAARDVAASRTAEAAASAASKVAAQVLSVAEAAAAAGASAAGLIELQLAEDAAVAAASVAAVTPRLNQE